MDKLSLEIQTDESRLAYTYRIAHLKNVHPKLETWQDVANVINAELDQDYDKTTYQKKVQEFDRLFEELRNGFLSDEYIDLLDKKRDALYKQQVKTGDKLREMRKHIRDEARIEILQDAVKDGASKLEPYEPGTPVQILDNPREAVLLLSDWHIGAKFSNFMNAYDLDIAKTRLDKVINDTISYCKNLNVGRLYVLNLGDLVEGNIHISVRVASEIDVIEQTMVAAEMLAYALTRLESEVVEVAYGDVLDNHGRINPNKHDHIEKENFGKLINWWLRERLYASNSRVTMIETGVDDNIGVVYFQNGKKAAFVHGHLDKINTVFQNLNGMLRETMDYVFMGHYHVAKMKEFNGGKVFVNGSLKGVDPYALSNRYMGRASQFLFVMDGDNEIPVVINLN